MSKKKFVLLDIDFTLFDTKTFKDTQLTKYILYEEVMLVLQKLSKIADLGIISKGESEFQKNKLKKTGTEKFFKAGNIHIFIDKDINLISVLEKYKDFKLFLVDDRLEVLHLAKKYMKQVFTIWVKRGWFAENQKEIPNFTPDAEVKNLSEVVRLVQSN